MELGASRSSRQRRAERRARRKRRENAVGADDIVAPLATPDTTSQNSVTPTTYSPIELEPVYGEGSASISDSLPSFDDFRRRDEQLAASKAANNGFSATVASLPKNNAQAAREKLMELFTFDRIDERPVNEEPYDLTARLIGRGLPNKAGVYFLPYLQSGHMLLIGVLLLSSLVSYPGFPLTQVPDEYRTLLLQGFGITYVLNLACAVYARGIAERKQQPLNFWFIKVLLLGGLALGELTDAVPDFPSKAKGFK